MLGYVVRLNFLWWCMVYDIHKITPCTRDRTANIHKCVLLLFYFLMGNWCIAQKSSSSRSSTLENISLPSDLGNKNVNQA